MQSSERTLKEEFRYALFLYSKVFSSAVDTVVVTELSSIHQDNSRDLSDWGSDLYQTTLQEAISSLKSAENKVALLSLFSSNETLDDVATENIVYLSIQYLLATLNERIQTTSLVDRRRLVIECKKLYLSFLTVCDSYELLDRQTSRLVHSILDANIENPVFNTMSAQQYPDAGTFRMARIARYKSMRAIEARVLELRRKVLHNDREDDTVEPSQVDEDDTRTLYIDQEKFFIERSLESLSSLDSELELLSSSGAQTRSVSLQSTSATPEIQRRDRDNNDYSEKLDISSNSAPMLTSTGKVNRPFVIVSSREQLKRNVFKPDYVLPTMSIDEYLEEERRRGNIIEGGGAQSANKRESDEEDEAAQDRETYRLRQWDEFTEANPRGSGNTKTNRG
ncbi:TAP42-like protein [Lipomyces oligophaga]|uniref:TAP42-like protein n=1 Tax=Lipomyces oligophaga TaxID=45792 RepID=UPI0034CFF0A0